MDRIHNSDWNFIRNNINQYDVSYLQHCINANAPIDILQSLTNNDWSSNGYMTPLSTAVFWNNTKLIDGLLTTGDFRYGCSKLAKVIVQCYLISKNHQSILNNLTEQVKDNTMYKSFYELCNYTI